MFIPETKTSKRLKSATETYLFIPYSAKKTKGKDQNKFRIEPDEIKNLNVKKITKEFCHQFCASFQCDRLAFLLGCRHFLKPVTAAREAGKKNEEDWNPTGRFGTGKGLTNMRKMSHCKN